MNTIYQWDELLTSEEVSFLDSQVSVGKWEFVAGEKITDYPVRTFWYMELSDNPAVVELFKTKVENFLGKKVKTIRLYANGQAHGQSALVHTDMNPEASGEWGSLVYYSHKGWRPEYGGHLVIIDENTITDDMPKVVASIFPKTNSAVMFNSKMYHIALEPTVYCRQQRMSIAYKFKIEE